MKKNLLLCLFVLAASLAYAQDSALNGRYFSITGMMGIPPNSGSFNKGIYFEMDKVTNGKSLGVGFGVYDFFSAYERPGNADDSVVQQTVFPLYFSLKYFIPKTIVFFQADAGIHLGARGEDPLQSPYLNFGFGSYPKFEPKRIPFSIRLNYQYHQLQVPAQEIKARSLIHLGFGFYLR